MAIYQPSDYISVTHQNCEAIFVIRCPYVQKVSLDISLLWNWGGGGNLGLSCPLHPGLVAVTETRGIWCWLSSSQRVIPGKLFFLSIPSPTFPAPPASSSPPRPYPARALPFYLPAYTAVRIRYLANRWKRQWWWFRLRDGDVTHPLPLDSVNLVVVFAWPAWHRPDGRMMGRFVWQDPRVWHVSHLPNTCDSSDVCCDRLICGSSYH